MLIVHETLFGVSKQHEKEDILDPSIFISSRASTCWPKNFWKALLIFAVTAEPVLIPLCRKSLTLDLRSLTPRFFFWIRGGISRISAYVQYYCEVVNLQLQALLNCCAVAIYSAVVVIVLGICILLRLSNNLFALILNQSSRLQSHPLPLHTRSSNVDFHFWALEGDSV